MAQLLTGTEAAMHALTDVEIGTYYHATDTERIFTFLESGWQNSSDAFTGNVNMSLYDMNKQIIAQLPDLEVTTETVQQIDAFVKETLNTHYMLYGKEISYFTIFQRCYDLTETVGEAVIDCLNNVGVIKSIDLTEAKDAFEIWVIANDEATCLYLFPYDSGIVHVGG